MMEDVDSGQSPQIEKMLDKKLYRGTGLDLLSSPQMLIDLL